uniref:uncharacterized metal-dependent hydrolase YabD-like isoform X2 n=1 Tax=Erigeron canadensis TaxID=72917 RepID=UPI001CB9267E|nr:uncharacterized metal-dependent hydrolase YabD-like isoform X2 [Erigeron canadensis]
MTKLFDAHCHLQDPRIFDKAPELIKTALEKGILHFAVNGISEKDWHVVKEMSDDYPSVVPSFGLHPWFIGDRTSTWFSTLKAMLKANPEAAVGEIGLDKGPLASGIDFNDQVEVFRPQLQLAKDLKRPVSVHCVDAFEELLDIMKSIGPFPEGVILHSYIGSAEMVPEFAKLGCYFSFSGHLMPMEETKAKKMLKAVPSDRILLETDSPDALPIYKDSDCLFLVKKQDSLSDGEPEETLNQPANIVYVLSYVASLLDLPKQELAHVSYRNSMHVFSFKGSKIQGCIQGKQK